MKELNKESNKESASTDFLSTEKGKTKSNAIEVPSITLPKGGGAIKGIDEKFSVNAINGTAAFSIPLPFSKARGLTPSLFLSYNSGAGNGTFGLGWNLGLSSIKRKTDKQLPQYLDSIDSDVFLFSDAEDLVAEFKKATDGSFIKDDNDEYVLNEKKSADSKYTIRFYKPRIEGLYARIERWTKIESLEIKWRIITKDNITTLFGWTSNSRLADPKDNNKIFEWFPEFAFDDKGNCSNYIYMFEDDKGIEMSKTHNINRVINDKITYSNLYLHKILYGNKTPYKQFGDSFPPENDFLYETVFDYGTLKPGDTPDQINNWDFREDAFSEYKAGFEIRTTRLCKRVLLFHHFKDANEYDGLVRSVNFEYDTNLEEDFTFLERITSHGYIKKTDGTYSEKQLPPMEFSYQKHDWNKEIKTIASENIVNAPSGLDEQQYLFTDLYNEGLNGILTEQAHGWYYKHNLGDGKFERAKLVNLKPSFEGLGSALQLADLDADGGKQLVSYSNEPSGFFELNDNNEWQSFRSFKALPNIDFGDKNTRMLDLNGDGKPEIVISEDNVFTWYPSVGREGFLHSFKTAKSFDEETGPAIVFADQQQTVYLADMSGSGMTDIVRIRNGEVCYWSNLGYGRFGAKTVMDNAPVFDHPEAFNPSYLRLADIDGSGTTDIIYLGKNKFTCWKNLSGNRFATSAFEIESFPEIHSQAKITVTDLLGNGVACIVWSSPLTKDATSPLKYIDLMNSKKPHIMVSYKNNLGKEVYLQYAPSTKYYLEDKLAGTPWVTKLHFPVHCITKTITEDKITGHKFISSYKYHHGYYDHPEREFRGFGKVEQIDAETFEHWIKVDATNITEEPLHQEPVLTKQWFHTGAFLRNDKILTQFENENWYNEMFRKGFATTHLEKKLEDAIIIPTKGIPQSVVDNLSAEEYQQAVRACKGMALRSEVFALDAVKFNNTEEARKRELTPYSVSTHNSIIELVQPKGSNKHAVFAVKEKEAISYSYERDVDDPRIAHSLNTKLDEYGNVLEAASVVYPRRVVNDNLPAITKEAQNKTFIIYTKNNFTNDLVDDILHPDIYRLPLPSETTTFELKEVVKTEDYYNIGDFKNILSDDNSTMVEYFEIDKHVETGKAQRRKIEHVRSVYYKNDLKGPLPLHQLESLALSYENYQLAYTPALLNDIFVGKVGPSLMSEGKYAHSENDLNWWVRSGVTQFIERAETFDTAQNRFYMPVSYTDPYGATTKVKYYGNYFIFIIETEDALGNTAGVEAFNFRTLTPSKMRDINGNFSEVVNDELGLVKALAIMGKGHEADEITGVNEHTGAVEEALVQSYFNAADSIQLTAIGKQLLQKSTTRFVYDLNTFMTTAKPVVVASIIREEHFINNNNSPIQLSFEYSDGLGNVAMKKVQAEPGNAKQVIVDNDNKIQIIPVDTSGIVPKQLRWIGSGRTILNNKGNPVKQYEPYFSVTHQYEDFKELVETGVTPVMYYDAIGRLVKTDMPNGTFTKVEFDSWKQISYDANDTVKESDWYLRRTDNTRSDFIADLKEQQAAAKASIHDNTPNISHFDTLGRAVLSVDINKSLSTDPDQPYRTKVSLDIEGNLRSVIDAREITENGNKGNTVMEYKYDMLGNQVYQNSMDAGQRWLLTNVLGNTLRTWDERDHEFQYFYDALHRPTESKVLDIGGLASLDHVFGKVVYGESLLLPNRTNEDELKEKNVLGQTIKMYDTGGLIDTLVYDFKGQPVKATRRLFKKYKEVANWTPVSQVDDLEADTFTFTTETDALGRITKQIAPDLSVITPSYNEAGLLNGESVLHHGTANAVTYIKDIDYNEKGQREKIIYGNDVSTKFYYNKDTFRLKRLETRRKNEPKALQDLYYTYDPIGNIITIEDEAIPIQFFSNQIIKPISEYTYDALYRLIEATGKENNVALTFDACDNWNDMPFLHSMNPGDSMKIRNYTQFYQYDSVGNISEMKHVAEGGSWTRNYQYEKTNNRLKSTNIGDNGNPANYTKYAHHAKHGYLEELPHLEKIGWNFKEEVVLTTRQNCTDDNIPVITYYQYDGQGQRIRKITENGAVAGGTPTKKEERIYISGYELYKRHSGADSGLERISLSLMDEGHRFVMIETRNDVDDGTQKQLVRYQLHNHLGSATLELDGTADARLISYEEYHPFGTTAYQAINSDIKSAAKRYRYTGMERDEETGLEYHSARYYIPWLGRWLSADPIGIKDGTNLYRFSRNNPLNLIDTNGLECRNTDDKGNMYDICIDDGQKFPTEDIKTTSDGHRYYHIPASNKTVFIDPIVITGSKDEESTDKKNNNSVEEPGFAEGMIPIWGSGKSAVHHFQEGNYGRGILYTGLAITDIFLVKALVVGVVKGVAIKGAATLAARELAAKEAAAALAAKEATAALAAKEATAALAAKEAAAALAAKELAAKEAAALAARKAANEATKTSVKEKLEKYLLNPEHEIGKSKADWFKKALGFTKSNIDDLAEQIIFDQSKAVVTATTEFGTKFNQTIKIVGSNGKTIDVVFAWIKNNDGIIRLVTAIPTKL